MATESRLFSISRGPEWAAKGLLGTAAGLGLGVAVKCIARSDRCEFISKVQKRVS